jgi:hypothetical protein
MATPPRLQDAQQDINAAIQRSPTNWQAWLQKGDVLTGLGDKQGAEQACLNAVNFADGMNTLTAQRALAQARNIPEQTAPQFQISTHTDENTYTTSGSTNLPQQTVQTNPSRNEQTQAPPPPIGSSASVSSRQSLGTPSYSQPSPTGRNSSSSSLVPLASLSQRLLCPTPVSNRPSTTGSSTGTPNPNSQQRSTSHPPTAPSPGMSLKELCSVLFAFSCRFTCNNTSCRI